ncbi:MAG: hypothetical protein LBG11_02455 [Bifidobacteriaceae bacterium]|jgi:uncharacterized protein YukE|nr:hypothetical protein [Bifidobacteriaceae bacterium]
MTGLSDELTVPCPAEPIPDLADFIINNGPTALISPSFWILEILKMFNGGVNPLDGALQSVSGDWNQAMEAAEALKKLAAFYNSLASDLRAKRNGLPEYWEGNAADAAAAYFEKLASAVDEIPSALKDASGEFNAVAVGMYEGAQAISGLLQSVADDLILMAVAAAATAASSWTGVGAIAGAAGLTVKAVALLVKIGMVTKYLDRMHVGVAAVSGLTAGYLGAIHAVDRFEAAGSRGALPSYDFRLA